MTTASICDPCRGETHTSCAGTDDTPCSCGCLASSSSLHRYFIARLEMFNKPMFAAVTRRIQQMRDDGKPPPL